MLVLSRREADKVLFPSLGISVEVLRVQGNKTQLGIEAPKDIPILRHEIASIDDIKRASDQAIGDDRLSCLIRAIHHRLDTAASSLNEMQHSDPACTEQMSQTLIEELFRELRELENEANDVLIESGVQVNDSPQALLVDDCANERRLLESYLDLCGFTVTTAEDGQQALEFLSMHALPDVVLLDMMMPRIDGPTFVRTVRADPKHRKIPIFALTGLPPQAIDVPTGDDGVNRWFIKPIDPKEVVASVATHLTTSTPLIAQHH
tara:strand:- start:556052 stop:556840 length:789 start_codon:yes stop_codon:yes gene_type:complete